MSEWMEECEGVVRFLLRNVSVFAEKGGGIRLRHYQEMVARRIVDSVLGHKGLSFVVMFPRQSGKNELQAQIEAYLLTRYMSIGGEMVKISPTWKPQNLNAMQRLERALNRNVVTKMLWKKEWGYIYRVGKAKIAFLSGAKGAHIVGATASLLLELDEAQEVDIQKYDKEIAPMAAAFNATRVFWGTAWTDDTLLAREMGLIGRRAPDGGVGQVFILTAAEVRLEVPEYGDFVDEQVRRLGRYHPMVRSQFFSETIASVSGLFTEQRRRKMQGIHPPLEKPLPGEMYALLLDVGGEDTAGPEADSHASSEAGIEVDLRASPTPSNTDAEDGSRAATALTVVRLVLGDSEPVYEVVQRYSWTGTSHARLYDEIKSLALHWGALKLVIDATGLGAGLASFLERAFPGQVKAFQFTQHSKSQLGWDFLALVETGRYKEYDPSPEALAWDRERDLQAAFWRQAAACEGVILSGPGKVLKWGVPDGRRDASGKAVHDDLLVSAALCAALQGETWAVGRSAVIPKPDIFAGMEPVY